MRKCNKNLREFTRFLLHSSYFIVIAVHLLPLPHSQQWEIHVSMSHRLESRRALHLHCSDDKMGCARNNRRAKNKGIDFGIAKSHKVTKSQMGCYL